MKAIAQLLRERIGLDAASVGPTAIERAVRLRMKARQITQPAVYLVLLRDSSEEWNELVESVVVTETWFFRDQESFTVFGRLVRNEWLPLNPARPLRVLSVPCSTGEEPYSLVMTLLDAGLPRRRFQVDAVDLSERALAFARAGMYSRNSFRGRALAFRDRYFRETKAGYELSRDVCDVVAFRRANILADDFAAGTLPYDFLFCRNLLIYFDRATQEHVLQKLHALLAPRGVLFLGPAELPLSSGHGFTPANLPLAFACRKAGPEISAPPRGRKPASLPAPVPVSVRPKSKAPSPVPPAECSPATPDQPSPDLIAARALADAGQLHEAAAVCLAHLAEFGPTAQAYYLLGLITEADASVGHAATPAAGRHGAHRPPPSALNYYRKALYLEPNHYESLLQLALLLEREGDSAGATAFRRRLRRLQTAQPSIEDDHATPRSQSNRSESHPARRRSGRLSAKGVEA